MKLDKKSLGLALGVVWGLTIFVVTLWADARGGGGHLNLLEGVYPGYKVTFGGSIVGLIYGFINGYIWGWAIARFYNVFAKDKD